MCFLLGYGTNEDRPQDLSCNKETTIPEVESTEREYISDSERSHKSSGPLPPISSVISPSLLAAVGLEQGLPTARPQIIVSPRKAAAAAAIAESSGIKIDAQVRN